MIESWISLCQTNKNHPWGQLRKTEKETPHTQDHGNKACIQPYHKQKASQKLFLCRTKWWALKGKHGGTRLSIQQLKPGGADFWNSSRLLSCCWWLSEFKFVFVECWESNKSQEWCLFRKTRGLVTATEVLD